MIKFFLPVLLAFAILTSCNRDRLKVDVSNISLKLNIDRFEKDLFATDTLHSRASFDALGKRYPGFFGLFVFNIIHLGKPGDSMVYRELGHFVANKDLRMLKKDVDSVYPNVETQKKSLEQAFRHFLYYYPGHRIPHVLTFVSGFNNAVVNTETDMGLGLDMFMGSRYKYYGSINFPRYLIRTLNPEHLVPTAMKGFAKQIFPAPPAGSTLLANMIYEGKILYFMDAMLPETADSAKIGYSAKQLQWCHDNEANIWALSVDGDKLFSTERKTSENFFADGPFTQGLSQDSPSRLGMFTGWQIIRKYMSENEDVTLQALMAEQDDRKILQAASYKP